MAAEQTCIKLLIDTEAQRVLFAEVGKEAADFIVGILTMPVGAVVKLLTKDSMVGSVGNVYASVESMDSSYMQSNDARDALLHPTAPPSLILRSPPPSPPTPPPPPSSPRSSSGSRIDHVPLISPVPQSSVPSYLHFLGEQVIAPNIFYGCRHCSASRRPSVYDGFTCFLPTAPAACINYVTDVYGKQCPRCMTYMTDPLQYTGSVDAIKADGKNYDGSKGYVQGLATYTVMDELTITPMSKISSISLLNAFKVKDVGLLEERTVRLGYKQGIEILKASFQSKTVLTDVFLAKKKRRLHSIV